MVKNILFEVCCGGIEDVVAAVNCKADRIELNSALELGGLTPSVSLLREVKQLTDIPVCCMVRPRGSGFCYSDKEYALIKKEAEMLLNNGADGIVFGFLKEDGFIDARRTKEFVSLIKPKEAVFHKAFDHVKDKDEAIKTLIDCGVDRILTSGTLTMSDDGLEIMKHLNETYGHKISILPGGGVNKDNIVTILKTTGCHQIHMTGKMLKADFSTYHGNENDDYRYYAVSEDNLMELMKITDSAF